MKTEKELNEGCGEWQHFGMNPSVQCVKGNLCNNCKLKLKTLQERNAEIKQAITKWIKEQEWNDEKEVAFINHKDFEELLQKLGLGK